jgi:hypothetical protein
MTPAAVSSIPPGKSIILEKFMQFAYPAKKIELFVQFPFWGGIRLLTNSKSELRKIVLSNH